MWYQDSIKRPTGVLVYNASIDLGKDANSMIKLIIRSSVLQVYFALRVLGSYRFIVFNENISIMKAMLEI